MPIITKVVSLNPFNWEVYLIQHYVPGQWFSLGTPVFLTNKTLVYLVYMFKLQWRLPKLILLEINFCVQNGQVFSLYRLNQQRFSTLGLFLMISLYWIPDYSGYGVNRFTVFHLDFDLIFGVLMPLSAIFQLYHGGQFYWWRKPDDLDITTDLSHVTDKIYHTMLYTSPWSRFELTHNISGDRHCKSNYHTIMVTTSPCIQYDMMPLYKPLY